MPPVLVVAEHHAELTVSTPGVAETIASNIGGMARLSGLETPGWHTCHRSIIPVQNTLNVC